MEIIEYLAVIGDELLPWVLSLIIVFLIRGLLHICKNLREKYYNNKSFDLLFKSIYQGNFDEDTLFGVFKNRNENLTSRIFNYDNSYDRFLKSFLVYSIKTDLSGSYVKTAKEVIDPIFKRPYSSVNERERRILLSIDDTMKKSVNLADSEKSAIKHDLDDLAIALEENQNTLEKCQYSNKLTWLGILLTVIFGIISMII